MKLAIYQMADRGEPWENLAKAYEAIVDMEADCFVLPEIFVLPGGDYTRYYSPAQAYAETGRPGEDMLREASLTFPGYLIGGTLIEETPKGYYNTCYVLRRGKPVAKYRKINITREEIDMQLLPGSDVTPAGVVWEGSDEGEELAVVDVPMDLAKPRRGVG